MTDAPDMPNQDQQVPLAKIAKRGFAWIWLVPIVALCIVAWLGWSYFAKQGPSITISFKRADGLEAGKTPVKYKNVTVGLVKTIKLSQDMSQVLVTTEMDRSMENWMGAGAQFWVVRPRFTSGNISGLDTLVSGAYVTMMPAKGDEEYNFQGLENPPVTLSDVPGKHFTLHADRLAALDEGSSIYYHGIEVGAVQGYKLSDNGDHVDIFIFVRDPYANMVGTATRFWNASAFDLNTTVNGFEVKTESFRALLTGGVAFDTQPGIPNQVANQNADYKLYDSERVSNADPQGEHYYYVVDFPGDTHGLNVRAPVQLHGIDIGRVVDISQQINLADGTVRTPITIELEVNRMIIIPANAKQKLSPQVAMNLALDNMIKKGLRAQLGTASLLTGLKYVQLNMTEDEPPAKLIVRDGHPSEIPALASSGIEQVTHDAHKVLTHADQMVQNLTLITGPGNDDLQATVKSLNGAVHDMDRVLNNVDSDLHPLGTQLPQLLNELKNTARSANSLLDYVDQHPDSLIFGRSGDKADQNEENTK